MKLKPLDDRIVIKADQAEQKTAGGIVLPDAAKEKPVTGKVIATGEGRLLENGKRSQMIVKKNDQVIYGKYSGTEVELEGTKYIIVRESDILGILES